MLNIDKCNNCLKCVAVCPAKVYQEKDGKPYVAAEYIPYCTYCLHCAAVCPEKAITLTETDPAIMDDENTKDQNHIVRQLLQRRSYRNYKDTAVSEDEIRDALELTAWSASAKNEHPVKFLVINSEEKLKTIMEAILNHTKQTKTSPEINIMHKQGKNLVMSNAKTIIIAYAKYDASHPETDSVIALHDAEMILQSKGIGTCWAGYLTNMCNKLLEIKEILNIPKEHSVNGALMIGYPENEEYIHIPARTQQVEIDWL